jgi:hypothetical protein
MVHNNYRTQLVAVMTPPRTARYKFHAALTPGRVAWSKLPRIINSTECLLPQHLDVYLLAAIKQTFFMSIRDKD